MNKYEAMFIVKPDLNEDDKKALFNQFGEVVTKNNGTITAGSLWSEKKKFYFPLEKYREGLYYLLSFSAPPLAIQLIRRAYKLNEEILRVLITKVE